METVERLVSRLRRELKLSGLPSPADAWRLAAHLADLVEVEVSEVPVAYCLVRTGQPALVAIPSAWDPPRQAVALVEELAHALLCPATPTHLLERDRGSLRLLTLWEQREEAKAREFVLAWLLPESELFSRDEEELCEASGLTAGEVRQRLETLLH